MYSANLKILAVLKEVSKVCVVSLSLLMIWSLSRSYFFRSHGFVRKKTFHCLPKFILVAHEIFKEDFPTSFFILFSFSSVLSLRYFLRILHPSIITYLLLLSYSYAISGFQWLYLFTRCMLFKLLY